MKHILLITTGGTIACRDSGHGLTPALTADDLLAAVPAVTRVCEVTTRPLFNLDSTDMTPKEWMAVASAIRDAYDHFDGFIITHGTDTLAYAAATLSCLLQHSEKPIVLTGAQLPLGVPGSDAAKNLTDAFSWALSEGARGVRIVFAGRVIRGLRARKRHTTDPDAFESVGCPDTALLRDGQIIRYGVAVGEGQGTVTDSPLMPCHAFYDTLDTRIALAQLTPGMSPFILRHMAEGLHGLIIEGVGIGGIPDTLVPVLTRVAESGVYLILTSQVPYGESDFTVYRAGRRIHEACGGQVVTARDIPSEAAFAAAMWAMAVSRDREEMAKKFEEVLRGADL
jgi:L-asparaginase